MPTHLVFRLHGAMASWGDIAVGQVRPTHPHPSKSAVLGLVAGALGIVREDEAALAALHGGYGFAVRVDAPGELLADYHTVQALPAAQVRAARPRTRRDELTAAPGALQTILSTREYRCDAVAAACLWPLEPSPRWSLSELQAALERPAFVPYLGRKSCPPSVPFDPQLLEAVSPVAALRGARFRDEELLEPIVGKRARVYRWEGSFPGEDPSQLVERRDQPVSRRRWQFVNRTEAVLVEEESSDVPEQD